MGNPNGHFVHGFCGTPLYNVWQTMKQRCENPKSRGFKWYGAKGIKLCEDWKSPKRFCEWALSNGYEEGLTIDRINASADYSPSNCRWISMSAQQSNKSSTHFIEYNGERHTLTEWSKILGIPRSTLSNRIVTHRWSIERAFQKGGKLYADDSVRL